MFRPYGSTSGWRLEHVKGSMRIVLWK